MASGASRRTGQLTVDLADCLLVQAEPRDLEVAVTLADRDGGGLVMTGGHAVEACGLPWRRNFSRPVLADRRRYKPARHMREYLSVLVPLLDGNPVSVDGSTLSAHIGLSTPRAGRVPVLLAALAPRMLELAGGQADGTVLWMTGPATVRDYVVPAITAAASAARPSPRVVCALPVCVTSDPDAARASADKELAIYGQLPSYRAMLDREGAAGPGDVAIVGDEDAVAAQIQALADAGVTDFVAAEVGRGEDPERTRSLLKAVIAAS